MEVVNLPFIIEFAGLPAAGKTTITALLSDHLRRCGKRTMVVSEAATNSPLNALKLVWHFNAWTLCQTTQQLLEIWSSGAAEVIIIDRGFFDAFCWIEWFKGKNKISKTTAKVLQAFASTPEWATCPQITFYLNSTFETALSRRGHSGRILNKKTFAELRKAYHRGTSLLPFGKKSLVLPIKTDLLTPNKLLKRVLLAIESKADIAIEERAE